MKRLLRASALMVFILFLFTGCTPYKELKELSIVQGMGVDTDQSNNYKMTFQVIKSQSGGSSSSGGGGSGGDSEIYISSGQTLFDSIRNTTLQVGRKLYFPSNQIFVIGEQVCRKNLTELFDFMQRNHDMRPNVEVYMAKGEAEKILTAQKSGQTVQAKDIAQISQSYYNSSKTIDIKFSDIYKELSSGITDIALPVVASAQDDGGKSMIVMQGTAVFNNNTLAGTLNELETRGYLWIMGKASSGIVVVTPKEGGAVGLEVTGNQSDIRVNLDKKGNPYIKIDIKVISHVGEVQALYAANSPEYKAELENLQKKEVEKEAHMAIDKALRQYNSDIFGFGMKIYEKYPGKWRRLSGSWNTDAKNIPVVVSVESQITQRGIISK